MHASSVRGAASLVIDEHVRGIGQQRQRAGQDPADGFDDHEPAGEAQREEHAGAIESTSMARSVTAPMTVPVVGTVPVTAPVTVTVAVAVASHRLVSSTARREMR